MKFSRTVTGFRTKIVLTIFLVGLLAVMLGLSVTYWVGRDRLQQTIGNQFRELARETSHKLAYLIEHATKEARLLSLSMDIRDSVRLSNETYRTGPSARPDSERIAELRSRWASSSGIDPFVQRFLENPASRHIQAYLREPSERAAQVSVLVTDSRGVLVGADSKPTGVFFGDQTWWLAAFDHGRGRTYLSDIEVAQDASEEFERIYVLTLAVPVMDATGERAIGVLRMQMQVKRFFDAVTNVHIAKTDHTMLASSDGTLLFCPVFLIRNHTLKPELMEAVFRPASGWAFTKADVHYGGRNSLNGFAPVDFDVPLHPLSLGGKRWYIFTSQDPRETYAPVDGLLIWITISGILGAVLLSILGFAISGRIVQPLQELQRGAKLIGYGNLGHRLRIRTGDEIEDLATEFNEMAIKLKSSYANLEQKVIERTRELAVINKINRIISSSLDPTHIFEALSNEVTHLIEYDRISLSLVEEGTHLIKRRLIKDRNEPLVIRDLPARPEENTAVGWTLNQARPMIRTDVVEAQQFIEDRLLLPEGLRSYIIIPIISKMKPVGTLNLASARPAAFSERNLEILVPIAEQLAIALETAGLFEQTKKLDQLKSEFVSKVSHELRTPLTSIKGFTEILLSYDDVEMKTQKEFLGIMHEECVRLTRLINDILDLSKIEAGKIEWRIEPVTLPEVISQALKSMKGVAHQKKLLIETRLPADLPLIRGDRDQLLQVLYNLISNAIKFTSEGRITVEAAREMNLVRVSVADTGCGIAPGDMPRLFDKFHQLGARREGRPLGTGLGLAISKEIISYLGGRIWCETELGRGSTFLFTIPVWDESALPASATETSVRLRVEKSE